ncbi:MAG: hypothetical protein LBS59_07500 [Puniceicoccales bacterium]|jgi:hypothetical protein|nr:hypothetical protein [Puniceicoccales bacterium]
MPDLPPGQQPPPLTPPLPALRPSLSAPKPAIRLPAVPPTTLPPPPGFPPPPPSTGGVRPSLAGQPIKLQSALETSFNESESTKESVPLVLLDFLALAASIAFAVLLWNDYLTLINRPLFN